MSGHSLPGDRAPRLARLLARLQPILARCSLGGVFVWFGALKVVGPSPARDLVVRLLDCMLPRCPHHPFLVLFGAAEVLLGLSFFVPELTPLSVTCVVLHLGATTLPLFLLPDITWAAPFVPTLEGQYILKNAVLLALALGLLSPAEIASRLARARAERAERSARLVLESRAEDGIAAREVVR